MLCLDVVAALPTLSVTSANPRNAAFAAINVSLATIGVPARSSAARIAAYRWSTPASGGKTGSASSTIATCSIRRADG